MGGIGVVTGEGGGRPHPVRSVPRPDLAGRGCASKRKRKRERKRKDRGKTLIQEASPLLRARAGQLISHWDCPIKTSDPFARLLLASALSHQSFPLAPPSFRFHRIICLCPGLFSHPSNRSSPPNAAPGGTYPRSHSRRACTRASTQPEPQPEPEPAPASASLTPPRRPPPQEGLPFLSETLQGVKSGRELPISTSQDTQTAQLCQDATNNQAPHESAGQYYEPTAARQSLDCPPRPISLPRDLPARLPTRASIRD